MARYFFFFFFAAFFFAIVSPPSRSPRVPRTIIARILGEGQRGVKNKIPYTGSEGPGRPHMLGPRAQVFSCAEDGLRCSRRFTYSWLSGTPFLHSGHASGA